MKKSFTADQAKKIFIVAENKIPPISIMSKGGLKQKDTILAAFLLWHTRFSVATFLQDS